MLNIIPAILDQVEQNVWNRLTKYYILFWLAFLLILALR